MTTCICTPAYPDEPACPVHGYFAEKPTRHIMRWTALGDRAWECLRCGGPAACPFGCVASADGVPPLERGVRAVALYRLDLVSHRLLDGYINAQRLGWGRLQLWQYHLCNAMVRAVWPVDS